MSHHPKTAGAAGRYAAALFDLARQAGVLDQTRDELNALGQALRGTAELRRAAASPLFDRDAQARAFDAVLERAGAHELTKRFVAVAARNRRLALLADMIDAFNALVAQDRGEISAAVASAHRLSDQQQQAIKTAIEEAMKQEVQLDASVDPELLGGLVVKIGSRMIDTSLRTQLNKLQTVMKEA